MKFRDYFIATIFGVVPWAYILSSIGNGIGDIVEAREFDSSMLFNLNYFLPILLIGLIVLSPIVYKFVKKRIYYLILLLHQSIKEVFLLLMFQL